MTLLPRDQVVQTADTWLRSKNDFLAVHDERQDVNVPRGVLASIDGRLPALLDELYRHGATHVTGEMLRHNLRYWSEPAGLRFMSNTTRQIYETAVVTGFNFAHDPELICVKGVWSIVRPMRLPDGSELYYAMRVSSITEIDVPFTWMETHYPGWRERLNTAHGLELGTEHMVGFVLGSISSVTAINPGSFPLDE